MDRRILNQICYFLPNPEKVLNSCKQFTNQRIYNIRWKNKVYYTDNRIKSVNTQEVSFYFNTCKEIWFKEGKIRRDDIDPVTGLTLHATIWRSGAKIWYKDGEKHRDEINPKTGQTLPAMINQHYKEKYWFKDGKEYCFDIDPETGLTLPSYINENFNEFIWHKNNDTHRDEIDPETGYTLPAIICNEEKYWYKNGLYHRDETNPEDGFYLPAVIDEDGIESWYLFGYALDY
jgi:hypothetical protein